MAMGSLESSFGDETFGEMEIEMILEPKVFGMKFSLREVGGIFSTKIRNFKLWKMPKLLNFMFSEG